VLGRTVLLALVLALVGPEVAGAGTLVVRSARTGSIEITGTGCGVPGSVSIPLTATASDVEVRRPTVGATTRDTRLTEVAVLGTSVRLTAVGDGASICDPDEDPDIPPAEREWSGFYGVDIRFQERVAAMYWQGAEHPRRLKAKPRKVTIPRVAHGINVRWHRWGGRKAVGFARIKAINPPGVRCNAHSCPGHGSRIKVVLTRPSRCPELGDTVFYGKVAFYMREKARFLKRGELYSYFYPGCSFGKPDRV
jgi:hypothetical protein